MKVPRFQDREKALCRGHVQFARQNAVNRIEDLTTWQHAAVEDRMQNDLAKQQAAASDDMRMPM